MNGKLRPELGGKAHFLPGFSVAYPLLILETTQRSSMNGKGLNIIRTQCCYCGMVKSGDQWRLSVVGSDELLSHGCCPACEIRLLSDLDLSPEPALAERPAAQVVLPPPPRPRRGNRVSAEAAV
jgi:hypothetical protein